MMQSVLPDIPRFYTALAEWLACVVYILPLKKKLKGIRLAAALAVMLLIQVGVQLLAGRMDLIFWVPGMIVAVAVMFAGVYICCDVSKMDVGYCCARAFITAEFAASLGWQIYCFFFLERYGQNVWLPPAVIAVTYSGVFGIIFGLEYRRLPKTTRLNVSGKEMTSAGLIAVAVFIISNVYFVVNTGFFHEGTGAALFFIRTLVDFSGLTMLYAQQEQRTEIGLRREVEALDGVLHRQYEQYKLSRDNIELLNRKYHDLKQQIAVIRLETDPARREAYLEEMEQVLKYAEFESDTGNKILDIVLAAKKLHCIENQINLTCVADGTLLEPMEAMDICTVFGNALDNAIESVMKLQDPERRLIKMAVYAQNNLLLIRFENYIEEQPKFVDGLPRTTKQDRDFHGYGIKSIRQTAEKYGGNMTIHIENDWFIMRILIPL